MDISNTINNIIVEGVKMGFPLLSAIQVFE
jgi:hypothetical protein